MCELTIIDGSFESVPWSVKITVGLSFLAGCETLKSNLSSAASFLRNSTQGPKN